DATAPSIQEGPFLVGRNRVLSGFAAFKRILLLSPLAYVCYVILLARQPRFFQYHRWLAAAVLIFFTPFLTPLGEAAWRWLNRSRASVQPVAAQAGEDVIVLENR